MGRIDQGNYKCEIMDGVKMELLLLNIWLIKNLVWETFSLLFGAIGSETYLNYVKVARYVKLVV